MDYLFASIFCLPIEFYDNDGPYNVEMSVLGLNYIVSMGKIGSLDIVDNQNNV